MFQKIKNKVTNTKESIKKVTNYTEAKDNFEEIKKMVNVLALPEKNKTIKKTFSEIVIEKGLTNLDLQNIYFNYIRSFYILFLFLIVCFGSSLYSAFIVNSFSHFLLGISMCLILLATLFRFSFYAFQIKKQKWCNFGEWYSSPDYWFPTFSLNTNIKSNKKEKEKDVNE